jgi:hypothetical protein
MIYNILKNVNIKNIIYNNIFKITQLSFNRNLSCHNLINNNCLYKNTQHEYIDYYDIENYHNDNDKYIQYTINTCDLCNGSGLVLKHSKKSKTTNDIKYRLLLTSKKHLEYEICKKCNGNGYI